MFCCFFMFFTKCCRFVKKVLTGKDVFGKIEMNKDELSLGAGESEFYEIYSTNLNI